MVPKIKSRVVKALLWSQKYTKADMLYVARGSSWTAITQGVNSILTLGLLIAFANLLPKEVYGQYSYILSIAGILNVFTLTGLNAAVARSVARGERDILRGTVRYQLLWNVGLFAIFILLSGYYYWKADILLSLSYLILGVSVPVTQACNTYGAFLDGARAFRQASLYRMASTVLYVCGMLIAILFAKTVAWLVFTYAILTCIGTVFFCLRTLAQYPGNNTHAVAQTVKYGRELTYIQCIDPIVSQIDKVIIGHFWGPGQLALYALAITLPNKTTELIKSWVGIAFPKLANKTPGEIHAVLHFRLFQGILIGLSVASCYYFAAPFIFKYILPQYLESLAYSQLLAITLIFAIPNRFMSLLFSSQGLSRTVLTRSFFMNCINIVLYIVGGFWGGIMGLIIANICSAALGFLLNLSLWHSVYRKSLVS